MSKSGDIRWAIQQLEAEHEEWRNLAPWAKNRKPKPSRITPRRILFQLQLNGRAQGVKYELVKEVLKTDRLKQRREREKREHEYELRRMADEERTAIQAAEKARIAAEKAARKAERAGINKSAKIRALIAEGRDNSYILRNLAERGIKVNQRLVNTVRRQREPKRPKLWSVTAQEIIDQLAAVGIELMADVATIERKLPDAGLVEFLVDAGRRFPQT